MQKTVAWNALGCCHGQNYAALRLTSTMPTATAPSAASKPGVTLSCNPRHPERTLLYRTVAEHFEAWFELASAG